MADDSEHPSAASYQLTADALDTLTDHPGAAPPNEHLHRPSDKDHAHKWIKKFVPEIAVDKIENKFHMGNYVIDRKTGEKSFEAMSMYVRLGMHLLYYGSEQEKLLEWKKTEGLLKNQSVKMGLKYDAPESVDHIQPFIETFQLQDTMSEMVKPDPKSYQTFNEFFAREIREDARPIDDPDNDLVASSPADSRLTAYQTVDLAKEYWIKGRGFTVESLLGDADLASRFEGGSIVIARLAPQDYHRWHAPVSGTVENIKDIPGTYYTVNPQAINQPGTLDVFCENKRSVMTIKRAATGAPVAVIAVGAMLVGSIKYNPGMEQPGTEVRRGQCLGAFYYGGSTVIVLYPRGEIVIDADLAKNSTEDDCETLMRVGWRVGEKQ